MTTEYETHDHDVLIIGAGGAGLRAALGALAEGAKVGVVSKSLLGFGLETGMETSPPARLPRALALADKFPATNFTSDTTATAVGSPPAPAPRNAMSPPYRPDVTTRF